MILKSEAEAKHEAEAEGSRGQGRSQRLRGRDQNFGLEAKISDALFYHNSLTSPTNCQPTNNIMTQSIAIWPLSIVSEAHTNQITIFARRKKLMTNSRHSSASLEKAEEKHRRQTERHADAMFTYPRGP